MWDSYNSAEHSKFKLYAMPQFFPPGKAQKLEFIPQQASHESMSCLLLCSPGIAHTHL